ncbi:MAG: universal stress protein, partial [Halobacteriota archaeon]
VENAMTLAEQFGATVHALYVVDTMSYASMETGSLLVMQALEDEGGSAVEKIEHRGGEAGVPVETSVVEGRPYREILDYVDDHDVDLVIMGTHGRRGVDRFLLGSVTEKVVRSCPAPVMTVRTKETE